MTSKQNSEYIFMDLEGNPLNFNPQDKIRNLYEKTENTIDYRAYHPETHTGIVELWGMRNHQEDRVAIGRLKRFADLTEIQRKKTISSTIKNLQNLITKKHLISGSTLCITIICGNKVYTASVGDSTAFLTVLDEQSDVIQYLRLNRILHNPTQEDEEKRLNQNYIRHGRLAGRLALSRALGDNDFEPYGLLHEPEQIYVDDVIIPKNGSAIIINACDGLTEGDCLDNEDIKKIIKANYNKRSDYIAVELATAAYENGSTDNISVLVSPIHPEDKHAKFLAVFDGHGGDEVSELLFQNVANSFDVEIAKQV